MVLHGKTALRQTPRMKQTFEAGLQQIEIHLRLETALAYGGMYAKDRCVQQGMASGGDIPAEMDKEIKEFLSE